jgi:4-amino-4-deoxy-L-arabinose transferase-like glycosyltransferase
VRGLSVAALILLFCAIYLGSAFTPALQDDVDTSHAEAAKEMLQTGDLVTLHINGVRYLEKAPLMYWLVALSYKIFGISDFATRLPTLLAMLGLCLLGLHWAGRAFGPRAGLYTGLLMATGAGCFLFTRVFIPEAILSLFIALSFYCLVRALEETNSLWWYGGYVLAALAVLTKGLIALVVIGMTLVAYLLVSGEWRRWREFRIVSGLVLFFAIAAPWHVLAALRTPETPTHHGFLWFYFINEHVMRFLGKRIPHDYNKQAWYLYWSLHLVWLFPWSLYLPVALRRMKNSLRWPRPGQLDFASRTRWVCLLWATVLLVFFSLSTNQEYYTFPTYFAIFMLLADGLAGEEQEARPRWLLGTSLVGAVVRISFACVLVAGLWSSRHVPYVADIGAVLSQTHSDDYTLSMGHVLDLTGQSFAALRLPAILAVIALLVGSLLELGLRWRKRHYAATWALAAGMALFLVAAHVALVRFDPYLSSRVLERQLEQVVRPEDRVMIYGDHSFGSSIVYYLPHRVELVNGRTSSLWFGSSFPDAPKIFWEDDDLVRLWNSSTRVFLFVPDHEQAKVKALLPNLQVYASCSGKVIYVNR